MNLDNKILYILRRQSGLTNRQLSSILHIPPSTVHRHVKKLEKAGMITGYRALIDYNKTHWPIGALFLISLETITSRKGYIPKDQVLSVLKRQLEFEEMIEVQASSFDLLVKARFTTLKHLSQIAERLRSIEGVKETTCALVTNEILLPSPPLIE